MTSKNVEYLREHGPTAVKDLPYRVTPEAKRQGVWVFQVRGTSPQNSGVNAGQQLNVAYLRDQHSKERVIASWLAVNADGLEDCSRKQIRYMLRRQGKSWHDAIDAVIPADGSSGRGGGERYAECPICHRRVTATHKIPEHVAVAHGDADKSST